jgi:hypothetical protein
MLCYRNESDIPAVVAVIMIVNDKVVLQSLSWYPDVGIEMASFGAAVIGGVPTTAGANDMFVLVGVVTIGDVIMVVGVALLGLAMVGEATGAAVVIFVALLVFTGVNVGAMGALVVAVISIHVIMEVMVVHMRVNQIVAAVVVAAVISTIDMDAFNDVQQLKSGSWAVVDALKMFLVLLVYAQLAQTKLTYTASIIVVSFVTVQETFLKLVKLLRVVAILCNRW